MSPTEMAYRRTAIAGASGFGLLISLYDTLAGDLRRAAEAESACDLEKRTNELHHALLVVAYLEDWVSKGSGGALAERLTVFYRALRRKVIEAQAKRSAEMLEQQMTEVLKVRELWQQIELRGSMAALEEHAWETAPAYAAHASSQYEHAASSWSA